MPPPSSHTTGHTVPYHGGSHFPLLGELRSVDLSPVGVNCAATVFEVPPRPRMLRALVRGICKLQSEIRSDYPLIVGSALQYAVTHLLWPLLSSDPPSPPLTRWIAQWQRTRLPRVRRVTFTLIPAASTSTPSVQVLGFGDIGRLTRCDRLICDFCSSGQCFACGFLQIPPRGGHPCRPASGSPCRAHRGLAPPSHPASTTCTGTAPVKALRAMPGAPNKNRARHASPVRVVRKSGR